MKKFNLIIIGGGAGAFAAAIHANESKTKTAIINTGLPIGGTCVNVGCVPSKALLWAGEILHQAKYHGVPGIELEVKKFDFQKVVQAELKLVKKMRQEKYEKVLNNLKYVTVIKGRAKFISQKIVEVNGEKLSAEKFIIAVGSTANIPPIQGLQETGFATHIEALKFKNQPKRLIVIGAGPVGLEFSQMYARFGTKVTILHHSPSIFSHAERKLTDRLTKIFINEGISVKLNVKIKNVKKVNNEKVVTFEINGKQEKIIADEILVAVGKTPNTQKLGLEKANIKIDKKQAIIVNKNYQTSNKNIFAVGDVTNAPLRLEITAGHEGTLAAENILKGTTHFINYNTVPYTIFTDPQLAGVGLTEAEQIKQMGTCACRTILFSSVPKAIIMNKTEGMIKMVIHPKTKQILGVHILGPNAGELIAQAMMLIKNKNTIDDIIHSLPMFPTLSEAIKIVALSFVKDISKLSCCV